MGDPNDLTWEQVDREKSQRTYKLGSLNLSRYIECFVCRRRSFNAADIEKRHCGHCNRFHALFFGGAD